MILIKPFEESFKIEDKFSEFIEFGFLFCENLSKLVSEI